MSYEQSRAQMAMWAVMASPLLMSVDLRTIRPEYKAILLNSEVIGVNQDPMGVQGRRVYKVINSLWSVVAKMAKSSIECLFLCCRKKALKFGPNQFCPKAVRSSRGPSSFSIDEQTVHRRK